MKRFRRAGCAAALLSLAAACGDGREGRQAVQSRLALQRFESCESLESYLEDTAVSEMRATIDAYQTGWSRGGMAGGGPESASAGSDAAAPQSPGPSSYTQTNTQVAGVEEADFVKNDGTRLFVLSGNTLYLNRSWPAADLATAGTYQVEGWPREMFLAENNRLVVFSNVPVAAKGTSGAPVDAAICLANGFCGWGGTGVLKVTVLDVADLAAPRVLQEYLLPGNYQSARRIGSSVRVVLSDAFRWPEGVRWYPESSSAMGGIIPGQPSAAFSRLIEENEKLIRAQTLAEWLPPMRRRAAGGALEEVAYRCEDFQRSNASTRLGLATVATLNLDAPETVARTTIVAEAGEIYASARHLYVANRHWWFWPEPGQTDHTYLHKFDITQPGEAVYVASGGVEGHILDQFSLDEDAEGYLRVATTVVRHEESAGDPWGRAETANRVSVMAEEDGALKVVGQTPDLAQGERIFSSRFVGRRGFLVTFRQVDPFFTLDLSNPRDPKVVGELKIPGFSTYIHPVDENHLLTIGSYVNPDGGWQGRAIKLSLFDVSDFAAPKEKFSQLVGSSYASSEAQYDHRAFNYFPEKGLLAVPFVDWNAAASGDGYWSSFVSELRVFHIDTQAGITGRGALSMSDVYRTERYPDWTYSWSPQVRRSVMADDFVYAVTDAGLRVANIADLSAPLKTVRFEPNAP